MLPLALPRTRSPTRTYVAIVDTRDLGPGTVLRDLEECALETRGLVEGLGRTSEWFGVSV